MPTRDAPPNPEVLRNQVKELLERLMQNREIARKHLENSGQDDPIAVVTGRTAIDLAIDTTKEMLLDLETAVKSDNHTSRFNTMCNGLSRLRSRVV
jgi:UDP-N-acetylglucosamine 2-epimerase